MDTEHAVVLFASLGLLAVAVVLVLASPAIVGDGSDGIQEARLVDFETTPADCAEPNATQGSAFSRDVPGGQRLFVNRTVPVAGPETEIAASFDSWGPGRHTLAITTVPGNESTGDGAGEAEAQTDDAGDQAAETGDCAYVRRYNATVEFARETDWTLLVTYDGELVGAHWHDGATGGSFDDDPATPTATNATRTATAANASATRTPVDSPGGGR